MPPHRPRAALLNVALAYSLVGHLGAMFLLRQWLTLPWLPLSGGALLLLTLLPLNGLAAALFAWDKRQARRAGARIPERHLLLLAASGAWMGAWICARAIRHKTRKGPFRLAFAGAVTVHLLLLTAILWC